MTALAPWQEDERARLDAVRAGFARRFGPKPIPTLHEYISASHSMLLAAHVARRSPPRPRYVHCFGCRMPSTPSGRRLLLTPHLKPDGIRLACEHWRSVRLRAASALTAPARPVAE